MGGRRNIISMAVTGEAAAKLRNWRLVRCLSLGGWAGAFLLVCVACGRLSGSGETTPSSPGGTASAPRTDPTAGWQTFNSPKLGYSLKYPPSLKYIGSVTSGPDPADSFSNENVGAPAEMDQSGIFFDISVNHDSGDRCLKHDLFDPVDHADNVVVDGSPTTLNVLIIRGSGQWPALVANILHGGYCYEIVYLARTTQIRDSYEQTALLMLGQTFRFGSGPTG